MASWIRAIACRAGVTLHPCCGSVRFSSSLKVLSFYSVCAHWVVEMGTIGAASAIISLLRGGGSARGATLAQRVHGTHLLATAGLLDERAWREVRSAAFGPNCSAIMLGAEGSYNARKETRRQLDVGRGVSWLGYIRVGARQP